MKIRSFPLAHSLAVAGFLFLISSTVGSHAASRQCQTLHRELTSLEALSSLRAGDEARRYDALARQQAAALNRARRDAAALQCPTAGRRTADRRGATCPALLDKIGKMENNLVHLEKKRDKAGETSQDLKRIKQRQRALRAQMRDLKCGDEPREASFDPPAQSEGARAVKRGLFARLFSSDRISPNSRYINPRYQDLERLIEPAPATEETTQSYGNVFRTLCVRICDGYYFPVSFATVRQSFDADEAFCKASNPHTEMRLFFHRNPGETSEDMQDLAGRLYTDLPSAFRYRREVADENICPRGPQQSAFVEIAGGNGSDTRTPPPASFNAFHGDRKTAESTDAASGLNGISAFPATYAAKESLFQPNPATQEPQEKSPGDYDPEKIAGQGIRVVGPTFLGDPQPVELRPAPAPSQAR